MIRKVNHVGIVVRSLDEALDLYVKTFGFERSEIMTREEMGMRSATISLGEVTFEIMEPIDDQSGIHAFLQKRGEGLHHVSLEVDDMSKGTHLTGVERYPFFGNRGEICRSFIRLFHPPEVHQGSAF